MMNAVIVRRSRFAAARIASTSSGVQRMASIVPRLATTAPALAHLPFGLTQDAGRSLMRAGGSQLNCWPFPVSESNRK